MGSSTPHGNSSAASVCQARDDSEEKIVYTHCAANCMSFCLWKCHVRDGEITYIESDAAPVAANLAASAAGPVAPPAPSPVTSGAAAPAATAFATTANNAEVSASSATLTSSVTSSGFAIPATPQMRACLRGRSARRWLQSPDRLNFPLRRVGKRGEGKFERITWDEAIDTIAGELKRIRETYGAEAIFLPQCSGVASMSPFGSRPVARLLNITGGYLGRYGTYSNAQIMQAAKCTYGETVCYGSNYLTLQEGELLVMFGNSPADTRMGGTGSANLLATAREKKGVRVICIDPRMSDTACAPNTEWIPIRTGTDAALCSALAYEIITNGWADEEFLAKYCIGYDEDTLPETAKGRNASYRDYILGTGYDRVPKTPAWAAKITLIPEQRIKDLAREMHEAKPLFIQQGYGSQRHSNGEMTARAIMVLPQLLGQIGAPGTNDGRRESGGGFAMGWFPTGENRVKTKIPLFMWTKAIDAPEEMTRTKGGVLGAEGLSCGIKFIFNYAGNCLTNQHGDINRTHEILRDESKCEFIVTSDIFMTDSAKYSDIVLPDLTSQEQVSVAGRSYGDNVKAVVFGQPVYDAPFERRGIYEVCCDIAERLGVYDKYSDGGKSREDWNRALYDELRVEQPQLPTWEDGIKMGLYKEGLADERIALRDFIADPEAHPLNTPSGKIEIYSEQLANMAAAWDIAEGDEILPVPAFSPGFDGYRDLSDEYPLLIQGFHYKAHTHSTYANNRIVQRAARHVAWINPIDAAPRGISNGDAVRVFNDHGEIRIEAKVTPRAMPGHVFVPQGAWYDAEVRGDASDDVPGGVRGDHAGEGDVCAGRVDVGGCINTLTSQRPSPIAKGNGQHSIIGQVAKA